MPTYAVLGATGSTGSAVIRCLTEGTRPDTMIRAYVRSKDKLFQIHPTLSSHQNVSVFEGTFKDVAVLRSCLHGVDVIMSCIGANGNVPGQRIACETAENIISTLRAIRAEEGSSYKSPTIVMLSSASVSPVFCKSVPWFVHWLLETALANEYRDLREAEELYRSYEGKGLLDVIFAFPPGLVPGDKRTGYVLSTEKACAMILYSDLGVGMVEMAERRDEFLWKGVTVVANRKVNVDWATKAAGLSSGLIAQYFPSVWINNKGKYWW